MQNSPPVKENAASLHCNVISGFQKQNVKYNNLDFSISQIKSKFNCIDILGRFSIQAKTGVNILCPIHRPQETRPSFNIYGDGQKFKCFSCGASGDCIDLFATLAGKDTAAAIQELSGHEKQPGRPFPRPPVKQPAPEPLKLKTDFKSFIADYESVNYCGLLYELWEISSFRPDFPTRDNPTAEAAAILTALYSPDDYIFIGSQYDAKNPGNVKQRGDWIKTIEADGVKYPLFCLNPVRPEGAANHNGEISFRTSGNIAARKYTLLEHDKADLRDQAAFWHKLIVKGFPVRAIVFSGNKSLHAIVETTPEEIDELRAIFTALGLDGQTYDPARTARLPGHRREDSETFQSIIYLRQ